AAAVSRALAKLGIEEVLVHTGQHFDDAMSARFFAELKIPEPRYHLGVHSLSHGAMTGAMLSKLEQVMLDEQPDWVLVYGDTNSTLAGALAAAKLHLPVAHVEAGLRSFNRRMPEEINRVVADHLSDLLFCPTRVAVENLKREGIVKGVHFTGDVMFDAALYARAHADRKILDRIGKRPFALLTLHRQENTDDSKRMQTLLAYVRDEAASLGYAVVFPVHPRTQKALARWGIALPDRIHPMPPVSYLEMAALLDACSLVFTDSGGLQKEAYFFGKRCVTLRDETEWVETVQAGWNRLWSEPEYACDPPRPIPDYGDGQASVVIARILADS
ncbi:MAG: UDP-N-acetylglucosamine 2-epimerase (non-hydrolyzing), partial [Zetaproteobacteria bacterium]